MFPENNVPTDHKEEFRETELLAGREKQRKIMGREAEQEGSLYEYLSHKTCCP